MQITELTFKQTQDIIWHKTLKGFAKELIEKQIDNYDAIIASLLPHSVASDKILRSGKRKGLRVIKFYDIDFTNADRNKIVSFFSGMDTVDEFYSVNHYIKNSKGQTMFSLVLGKFDDRFQYQCHWYHVWEKNYHLRNKLHSYLQVELEDGTDAKQWISINKDRYVPMTGDQFNKWFFSQPKSSYSC